MVGVSEFEQQARNSRYLFADASSTSGVDLLAFIYTQLELVNGVLRHVLRKMPTLAMGHGHTRIVGSKRGLQRCPRVNRNIAPLWLSPEPG